MDKLTKEAKQHGEVFEAMTFFRKSLRAVSCGKTPSCIRDIRKFFQTYIVAHFEFEENDLFPAILKGGSRSERRFIQNLQEEHNQVLDTISRFKDLVLKYGSRPNERQLNRLTKLSKEIISTMLKHARKEDSRLFPILKKYRVKL